MAKQKEKNGKKGNKKNLLNRQKQKQVWWRNPKWIRCVCVVLLSVIFIILSLFWIPAEMHTQITERYVFTAQEGATVHLTVLLPTTGPTQAISDPEVTWPGSWDLRTEGRLQLVQLEAELPADEDVTALITYQVNLFQGAARWVTDPVRSADLASSALIESDSPETMALAEALQETGDEERTVRSIYYYTLQAPGDGAAGSDGRANLLAALSRAAELPAKTVTGLELPEMVSFIPVSKGGGHPAEARIWNEVFYDSAWGLVDPNGSGRFYQHPLIGWTDGKHLVYDEVDQETQVFESLKAEAQFQGVWTETQSAPLRFVAWSDSDVETIALSPTVTLRKTWDARWVMIAAILVILLILNQLMTEDNHRSGTAKKKA